MALFSSAVIVFFGFSFLVQNHFMKAGGNSVAYKVTGIAYPFTYLLKEEYKRSPESQTLDRISKYVDIEKAVTYVNGDAAFWDGVYDNIKTDEQFNAMVMDLLDLVKNNPKEFLKERLSNFDKTSQVADEYGDLKYMRGSLNIFNFDRYLIASPIDVQLRVSVLKLLNANSGILFIDHLSLWTYNLYIPLILLIVMWMIGIVRRKQNKMLLLITSFLLVQFTAIFVTAPGSRFMYYFPVFICSYGLFLSCFPEKARCYLQKRKMEN